MKFGVLWNKTTMNIGDDIQTYASARFLPNIDYVLDRESLDTFSTEENEPVAVIMSAWWMWKKWNWPPAECIIPKLVSMHINNYDITKKGSPVYNEWIQGIGGEYLKAYGPVGLRDKTSLAFFKEQGIESYFSGCVTLTLPKQETTKDAGKYVCLVDLKPRDEKKVRELLKDSGLEIRVITHNCDYRTSNATFEKRMETAKEYLTLYQNAKLVVTRRLHVTLPCLAMEVPVLAIVNMNNEGNTSRWKPYRKWVHHVSERKFRKGEFEFDFLNPPPNSDRYKKMRERLTKDIEAFIAEMQACDLPLNQVKKTTYTKEEADKWQKELMRDTLDKWMQQSRLMVDEQEALKREQKEYQQMIRQLDGGEELLTQRMQQKEKDKKRYELGSSLYPKLLKISEVLHLQNAFMKLVKKTKKNLDK